jgi:uncharacterized integral membrane protein (TIGR00698 family)
MAFDDTRNDRFSALFSRWRLGARAQAGQEALVRLLPGVALSAAVAASAKGLELGERQLFGRNWLESLVIAILVGALLRLVWTPGERWRAGIRFSGKALLEVAIVLLGASLSAAKLLAAGPGLLLGVPIVVAASLGASYSLSRLLGLSHRMATLVACGNSICGNSAIVAVAPVVGAKAEDIMASIAFTAVLGVLVVIGLPALGVLLHMSGFQFGALAGLTVYAVPQVLAATAPMGTTAVQIGTLIKLVRVLMLGPVCLVLSVLNREHTQALVTEEGEAVRPRGPALHKLVPWFIIGFLALMGVRSADLLPPVLLGPIGQATSVLTVISMAALGLSVDVRAVATAGVRVSAAVSASLIVLGTIGFALIRLLKLA